MKTFRIFFEHGQAHDTQADHCELKWPEILFYTEGGDLILRMVDSDIATVREVTTEAEKGK